MPTVKFTITQECSKDRFDLACVFYSSLSRRKIRSIIDIGGAYLNGKRVKIASRQVCPDDRVVLIYNDEELKTVNADDFLLTGNDILYEDSELVVVNKPAGLCSQATRSQSRLHLQTLVEKYLKQKLKLVHRLDMDTSGAIILAKNDSSCIFLQQQFKDHLVEKTYHAICFGKMKKECQDHSSLSSIGKDGLVRIREKKYGGKEAFTRFRPLMYNPKYNVSLIECFPLTGRSHQIRVHLEHQGLVLVGEKKYGGSMYLKEKQQIQELVCSKPRGMLHAYRIKFNVFNKSKSLEVKANYPKDFSDLLDSLGFSLNKNSILK